MTMFWFDFSTLGDNVDCWMEIQSGKGPWAPPVSGIVPIGSTLTLVVAINDYRGAYTNIQNQFLLQFLTDLFILAYIEYRHK